MLEHALIIHSLQNYVTVSGKDVDALWQIDEINQITPQWHATKAPKNKAVYDSDDDDDDMPKRNLVRGKGEKNIPFAITMGDNSDSDGSMPSLQTVSNSSDEDLSDSDYEDEDDEDDESDESGYDTDEEDMLRDMLREAMDTAMAMPDFFDTKTDAPEFDALAEERKGNPFLKLLGSLRGMQRLGILPMHVVTNVINARPYVLLQSGYEDGHPRRTEETLCGVACWCS